MSSRIPIDPPPRARIGFALIIIGGALFCVGLGLIVSSPFLAVLFGGPGLLLFMAGVISHFRTPPERRFLEIGPDGFVLFPEQRFVPDRSVIGLRMDWELVRRQNQYSGYRLHAIIYVRGGDREEPIPIRYRLKFGQEDEITPLLSRLVERCGESIRAGFAHGKEWRRRHWELTESGLTLFDSQGEEFIPGEVIVLAESFGDNVRIWCRGEIKPVLQVPTCERDVLILLHVVQQEFLDGRSRREEVESSDSAIVCFERNLTLTFNEYAGAILGGILLFVLAPVVTLVALFFRSLTFVFVGLSMFGIGLLRIRGGWNRRKLELSVYPSSLRFANSRGIESLRFADVELISCECRPKGLLIWMVLRVSSGAVPDGEWRMTLTPLEGTVGGGIQMWAEFPVADPELHWLREAISERVAERLLREVIREGEVWWTNGVRISPNGIAVRGGPRAFQDGDGWWRIPFENFREEYLNATHYKLKTDSGDVRIESDEANFWPGLSLVRYLRKFAHEQPGRSLDEEAFRVAVWGNALKSPGPGY